MKFDSLVFDLDGTFWDTCEACAIAWNTVLSREGIAYRTILADDVRAVTGKPHEECIRITFADLSEEQIQTISAATMTEDNAEIERRGGVLYDGVREYLPRLREKYRLFIVSNCQTGYIETFLRLNDFAPNFEDIECWGNTGRPKGENLRALIDRNGLERPIMIGDADGDEKAARDCEIPFVYVSYGFGKAITPELTFKTFPELAQYFLNLS